MMTIMWGLSKRRAEVVLGLLWLIDAVFQLQPQMFSAKFAKTVLLPVAQSQPLFVSSPIRFAVKIFLVDPILFNSLFVLAQLLIGVFIINKNTAKIGLRLSVFWAVLVWIFGEGYGGIFSGHALMLMGETGAAIVYAILAMALLISYRKPKKAKFIFAYWLIFFWCIIWLSGAIYQLLPGQNTAYDLSSMLLANTAGAPKVLRTIDQNSASFIKSFTTNNKPSQNREVSNITFETMPSMSGYSISDPTSTNGYIIIILLAVIQAFIGFGVFLKGLWKKVALCLGIIISLVFWIVGQNLGNYYSGTATDLNLGPLIILMALIILGIDNLDMYLNILGNKLKHLMIGYEARA